MSLSIVTVTMDLTRAQAANAQWQGKAVSGDHEWLTIDNSEANVGYVPSLQQGYENTTQPVIACIHDDVDLNEPGWDKRVLDAFGACLRCGMVEARHEHSALNPAPSGEGGPYELHDFIDGRVGVVGFGGALQHGHPDIYKVPYQFTQLARFNYVSNTVDAEVHGQRFTGSRDVAVLDGFALFVRRELLDRAGGWPVDKILFHCYDYVACCLAHRFDYRVRMVGVACKHHGGLTSTTKPYQEWLASRGLTDAQTHEESHRYIYDEFRDVLPWSVEA